MKKILDQMNDMINTHLKSAEKNPEAASSGGLKQAGLMKRIVDMGLKGKWLGKPPTEPTPEQGKKGWIKDFFKNSFDFLKKAGSAIGKKVSDASDAISKGVDKVVDAGKTAAGKAGDAVSGRSKIPPSVRAQAKIGHEYSGLPSYERGRVLYGKVYGPMGSDPEGLNTRKYYGQTSKGIWKPAPTPGVTGPSVSLPRSGRSPTSVQPSPGISLAGGGQSGLGRAPFDRSTNREPAIGTSPKTTTGRPEPKDEPKDEPSTPTPASKGPSVSLPRSNRTRTSVQASPGASLARSSFSGGKRGMIREAFLKEVLKELQHKISSGKIKDKNTIKKVLRRVIKESKKDYENISKNKPMKKRTASRISYN
jgi:hypothetical protein